MGPGAQRLGLLEGALEGVTKLGGLSVIHRDDEASPTLERNLHNNQTTLADSFHRSIAGTRLHRCHFAISFNHLSTSLLSPQRGVGAKREKASAATKPGTKYLVGSLEL